MKNIKIIIISIFLFSLVCIALVIDYESKQIMIVDNITTNFSINFVEVSITCYDAQLTDDIYKNKYDIIEYYDNNTYNTTETYELTLPAYYNAYLKTTSFPLLNKNKRDILNQNILYDNAEECVINEIQTSITQISTLNSEIIYNHTSIRNILFYSRYMCDALKDNRYTHDYSVKYMTMNDCLSDILYNDILGNYDLFNDLFYVSYHSNWGSEI